VAGRPAPIPVLELLVSSQLGGGPAHVADLLAGLDPKEFCVTVGAPAGGPYFERFREAGAEVVDVAADRLSPFTLGKVTRLIREREIRVVHSHGKGAGLYGRLAARRAGVAAVHTFHGLHYDGYPPGARSAYIAMERGLARITHTIIHVSASQAERAGPLGLVPAERARVIVNGIDAARVRAQLRPREGARTALGLDPTALVLGTVARFDPVKGLETLLEAMGRLRQRRPGAVCLVVGDGPESGRLRARARRLGLGGTVVWAGPLPDAARYFAALDVYVTASLGEGLPLGVLEAMASGLPVVATRVSGHVDTVADGVTGLLVPPRDPPALAEAADALLADGARRLRMGEAARERVVREFSVARMTAEVGDVYRRAAASLHGEPHFGGV
jgi:glycosyltransferase involved in cell wall biosynthesis